MIQSGSAIRRRSYRQKGSHFVPNFHNDHRLSLSNLRMRGSGMPYRVDQVRLLRKPIVRQRFLERFLFRNPALSGMRQPRERFRLFRAFLPGRLFGCWKLAGNLRFRDMVPRNPQQVRGLLDLALPELRAGRVHRWSVYRPLREYLRKRGLGMNCQLRKEDEFHAVCIVCKRRIRTKDHTLVRVKCPGKREPSAIEKAANYAKAVTAHFLTGAETRADKEVEELLRICQTCSRFDHTREVCTRCGCVINKHKNALRNKLRMKSQHCPEKLW